MILEPLGLMPEIVNLSCGPLANYLNVRFYNSQASYFAYTNEQVARSLVDPNVRFVAGKEYTPRAVFWDFRHGFGSLHRYTQAYEPQTNQKDLASEFGNVVSLNSAEKPKKGQFWTDSLKFPLHPSSQYEIPNWEFDPIEHPYGQARGVTEVDSPFVTFNDGQTQFEALDAENDHEYLDVTIRKQFEKCDSLGGINIATDFTGWGGFTSAMLEPLRDDFAAKSPVIIWAADRAVSKPTRKLLDSKLEMFLSFSEFASLVVPLSVGDKAQFAEDSAKLNLVYETIGVMSNLRKNSISMQSLIDDLTIGSSANIVAPTAYTLPKFDPMDFKAMLAGPTKLGFTIAALSSVSKTESKVAFARSTGADLSDQDLEHIWNLLLKKQKLIDSGTPERKIHDLVVPEPLPLSQYPEGLVKDILYCDLSLTDGPRHLRDLVGPYNHELKERVYDLAEDYIWGYESDDDFD